MACRSRLSRNGQHMYGRLDRRISRRNDYRPMLQECSIERGEQVILKPGVTTEMWLYGCRMPGYSSRKIRDYQPGFPRFALLGGKLRHVSSIDEYESDGRLVQIKTFQVRGLQCRYHACRLKRELGERRNIGKAPILIARGWELQRADTVNGACAQLIKPCQRTWRQLWLPLKQAIEIAVAGNHAHAQAP